MPTVNIPSQIVVQTAAQWAADATVYSEKRILVTSDAYYGATDQRKFKLADGAQTWSNLDYMPVADGAGTVTSVSVVTANGFAGTVANATTTPAITITTSITGLLIGNGTAISAATASDITGQLLTGYVSGAGVVAATDTILQAFNKINGNIAALVTGVSSVTGSGNIASSGGATPNITFTGVLPTANGGTGVNIASAALVLGTASTTAGQLTFSNATNAFTQTLRGTNPAASIIYDLPTTAPTAGQVLSASAPSGSVSTLSWVTASSGITVGVTTSNGTNGRLLFSLSSVVNESSSVYIDQSGTDLNVKLGRQIGTTGNSNVIVGYWASYNNAAGMSNNVIIGANAVGPGASVNSINNVFIGSEAGNNATNQAYTTALGYRAGRGSTNFRGIYLGHAAGNGNTFQGIIIGVDPPNLTAAHQCIIGSNDSNAYIDNYYLNGVTHTAPYSVTINATGGSGSNVAGANLTDTAGKATGNAASGNKKSQTSVKGASGSTLQSLTDRQAVIGKYVDITESAATTYGTLALTTSGTVAGGVVVYTIEANDGTDYQSLSGNAVYSVVNKAGTLTVTFTDLTQATALSAGTLTATMTAAVSGTSVQFQANAVSSLAQTVLRISFQVFNQFGVAIISAA